MSLVLLYLILSPQESRVMYLQTQKITRYVLANSEKFLVLKLDTFFQKFFPSTLADSLATINFSCLSTRAKILSFYRQ